MKKLFLFTVLSFICGFTFAQEGTVSGYVINGNESTLGETVYIMTMPQVVLPSDTVASTTVEEDGSFSVSFDIDSIQGYAASTTACPDFVQGFYFTSDLDVTLYIDCDSVGTGTPSEYIYFGGMPINEASTEWYFVSTVIGEAVSYNWTIDGNNFSTANVTYLFEEPGFYTITLEVEMASGNTLTDQMGVYIQDQSNCQALFFPYIDSTNTDQIVFVNASIGDNLSYIWNFGDGTTSNEAYPSHTFADSADYTVCLTILGDGCQDQYCLPISPVTLGNWTGSGIVGGSGITEERNAQGQAKDNGFEFIVVPFPSAVLATSNFTFNVELNAYPNPTDGSSTLSFSSEKNESAQIRMTDMTGKLVALKNVNISTGINKINLDLSQLTEGVYIMFFESGSGQRGITKVVVQ